MVIRDNRVSLLEVGTRLFTKQKPKVKKILGKVKRLPTVTIPSSDSFPIQLSIEICAEPAGLRSPPIYWIAVPEIATKGQLISKCPFGVIVLTKIPTIFL